ncbi:hypothetical protein VNO78_35154 [Psophocarpus tetragonolobus]|uniref:Uncharacterized protein n=1 Tax=Psophocarpus tetragonolobus TaxID=3891 RepID=A0AAN9RLQ4_PSOTE
MLVLNPVQDRGKALTLLLPPLGGQSNQLVKLLLDFILRTETEIAATLIHMLVVSQMRFHRRREPTYLSGLIAKSSSRENSGRDNSKYGMKCVIKLPQSSLSREFRFSSPLRKVLFVNKASSSLNTGNSKASFNGLLPCSMLQKEGLLKHIASVVYGTSSLYAISSKSEDRRDGRGTIAKINPSQLQKTLPGACNPKRSKDCSLEENLEQGICRPSPFDSATRVGYGIVFWSASPF